MQIAICDDESLYCEKISGLIREYKHENPGFSFQISTFSSGKELLNYIDEYGGFDLYILDIVMPQMNGIQLACALRDRHDRGMVVYLTNTPEFAVDSYKVRAFWYLLKPVDASRFFSVMDEAYNCFIRTAKEVVSVKTHDSVRMVPVRDILYAERTGKQVSYYLEDNIIILSATFNDSFKNAVSGLMDYKCMLLVGSSFVVNLAHVTEVTKFELIFEGGQRVPVPRRMHTSVKTEWAHYWLNGGKYHVI